MEETFYEVPFGKVPENSFLRVGQKVILIKNKTLKPGKNCMQVGGSTSPNAFHKLSDNSKVKVGEDVWNLIKNNN